MTENKNKNKILLPIKFMAMNVEESWQLTKCWWWVGLNIGNESALEIAWLDLEVLLYMWLQVEVELKLVRHVEEHLKEAGRHDAES